MTLSSALSSALSGLSVSKRAAAVVSDNVANAMTEEYGPRGLELGARSMGGVQVAGLVRSESAPLLSAVRSARSAEAAGAALAEFHRNLSTALGGPEDPGSLQSYYSDFESALVSAASRPDDPIRLAGVVDAADALAGRLGQLSDQVQSKRLAADRTIASDVADLNQDLRLVADLNASITRQIAAGQDASALMDQRRGAVDRIADLVDIAQVERPFGQIALITKGGAILLDGRPAEIGFAPVQAMDAASSVAGGALSSLTLNGKPVDVLGPRAPMGGGRLAGAFAIRDDAGPEAQAHLDALADDLISRFAGPTTDPTLTPGEPGLFVDAADGWPLDTVGLAGRLQVTARLDRDDPGTLHLVRSGLGASTVSADGDSSVLQSMRAALNEFRPAGITGVFPSDDTAAGHAISWIGEVAAATVQSEAALTATAHRHASLRETLLSQGVDSDAELARLLQIETAFNANAEVIRTLDDMLEMITGLTR